MWVSRDDLRDLKLEHDYLRQRVSDLEHKLYALTIGKVYIPQSTIPAQWVDKDSEEGKAHLRRTKAELDAQHAASMSMQWP